MVIPVGSQWDYQASRAVNGVRVALQRDSSCDGGSPSGSDSLCELACKLLPAATSSPQVMQCIDKDEGGQVHKHDLM